MKPKSAGISFMVTSHLVRS